jgi:glutathione S-transferase
MRQPTSPATIIGGPVSPFVRKVLATCEAKGVPYRLDPIVPFFGDDSFSTISPLRRIPVYIDDAVTLCDSTVICEYLEDRYPSPRLLPPGPAARAEVRWVEEFADTRLADVCIWRIFYQAVILPFVFGKERDKAKIAKTVSEDLPQVLSYLERIAPADAFLIGELSLADIAVAAVLANLKWARVSLEARRWPKTLAWVERTTLTPGLAKITALAERLMQTPTAQHRSALADLGVALTETSFAAVTPRPGVMPLG